MAVKAKRKKNPPTVEVAPDSPIVQTNKLYVSLREIGHCNEKGRSVMSMGYSGKVIAVPDKPLSSLMASLVKEISSFARWSSNEAATSDLAAFKEYVASMEFQKNES